MRALVYLATPYSSPCPALREIRFQLANRIAGYLMRCGYLVYSPISHGHPIAQAGELPGSWEYWAESCERMLGACYGMFVVCAPGWRESAGVRSEVELAKRMGKSILMLAPEQMGLEVL